MAASRSRFYVDTPPPSSRDPAQRHSMFVSPSELDQKQQQQDLSSASSSATLPSVAGSVDRLTGLGEKKPPKFFTLKPKTSFSLRPFFSSSTSIASRSPSKRRKSEATTPRRDSYVQTDDDERAYDEVGVQTLNASTVDVPVQTCFREWEDSDIYGHRTPLVAAARGYSRWPAGGYFSNQCFSTPPKPPDSAPEDPAAGKYSFVAPPRLLKYAAPAGSAVPLQQTPHPDLSAVTSADASACDVLNSSQKQPTLHPSVPVKHFSAKQLAADASDFPESSRLVQYQVPGELTAVEHTLNLKPSSAIEHSSVLEPLTATEQGPDSKPLTASEHSSDLKSSSPENTGICVIDPAKHVLLTEYAAGSTADKQPEVSGDFKHSFPQPVENPVSVLKVERTDSPSKHPSKHKTVHFELSESESPKPVPKSRNVDKDFDALLRDLDILTDSPCGSELETDLNLSSSDNRPKQNLCSSKLKSAFDILRQDFLDPIPENKSESNDTDLREAGGKTSDFPLNETEDDKICKSDINKLCTNSSDAQEVPDHKSPTPTVTGDEDGNKLNEIKGDSLNFASSATFATAKSDLGVEVGSKRGNVYEPENKSESEKLVKTATLPTPPSFFESVLDTPESIQVVNCGSDLSPRLLSETNVELAMQLERDFERPRLSRSSSRSSTRSNSRSGFNALYEINNKFDSCENLDQLEEEIIRSLYTPVEDQSSENVIMNSPVYPPVTRSFETSPSDATHIRSAILDRLLSGESVQDIVPRQFTPKCPPNDTRPFPENKRSTRPGKKYVATITRLEQDNVNTRYASQQPETVRDFDTQQNNFNVPNSVGKEMQLSGPTRLKYTVKNEMDSPKKTSVFLFPEINPPSSGVPENASLEISMSQSLDKPPPVLEVRRSSWSVNQQPVVSDISGGASTSNTPQPGEPVENKALANDISGQCDFSNCLRPSKIQSSPFFAEIRGRSMSPRPSPVPPHAVTKSGKTELGGQERHAKPSESIGQCDFASCLKPSQVQNSSFSAELSELTASKSCNIQNDSMRTNSPFAARTNSPAPPNNVYVESRRENVNSIFPLKIIPSCNDVVSEVPDVKHKSELQITLQTGISSSKMQPSSDSTSYSPQSLIAEDSSHQDMDSCSPVSTPSVSEVIISLSSPQINSSEKSEPKLMCKESPLPSKEVGPPPPPPPPPPPSPKPGTKFNENISANSMELMIRDQQANLAKSDKPNESKGSTPKTPMMIELEKRFESRSQCTLGTPDTSTTSIEVSDGIFTTSDARNQENNGNVSFDSYNVTNTSGQTQNGSNGILSEQRGRSSSLPNGGYENSPLHDTKLAFSPNAVVTDEPPPPGAVLLDKKITIDGDKVHTDKFYAIPVKEVLKEKISTTKFIPAPPKYEGIGPTEDGVPIGLRNSVKKENMHNWYKTMFKSLHKADSSNDAQEYIIGYSSEPETSRKDKMLKKKSATLDNRLRHDNISKNISNFNKQDYPPAAKSSLETYNVRPRLIEDYEPGHSSVTDDEIITGSKRFLPALNVPKPTYEFKNGYEQDSNIVKKTEQPEALNSDQQKMWYREIQRGGDIPSFGLGKPPPEKPKDPCIGPIPPPPLNYHGQPTYQQAIRPLTLPADYANQNGNSSCHQMNGVYEMQMRQAIHTEMQQRRSPSSHQLSPPNRSVVKSPSRSPDLKIPARALFDFKAESPKEIPLRKGDTVLILRQLDKNWYEGEHQGVIGIFPISYVEIVPPEHVSTPVKTITEGVGRALYDFVAQTPIELTVRKGDTIALIRRVDANWYEAHINNKKGIIPASYMQILQEPLERTTCSPSPKQYISSPRNGSEMREKLPKSDSNSPSPYSACTPSPLNLTNEKGKLPARCKKGSSLVEPVMYRAMFSYSPQNSDELELLEGDTVYVVEMCDDGWYVGTSVRTGIFGIFPGNYVEKV